MGDAKTTVFDFLQILISSTGNVLRCVAVMLVTLGLLFGVYFGVIRTLPMRTQEFKINGVGSIVFSQQIPGGGHEYLLVVHPQGWQETAISVKEGDTLTFEAGGNVYIDLGGLNRSLETRYKLEDEWIRKKSKGRNWIRSQSKVAPEDDYSADQVKKIKPRWAWNGPDGNIATTDLSFPSRRNKTIVPSANYGTLLAAIRETGVPTPARQDAFVVGSRNPGMTAKRSGKLYFVINDVLDDKEPNFPDKFFIDNIGFFYVKVTVTPAGKQPK